MRRLRRPREPRTGFCRLVTGSGFATRKLYTNEEEVIFSARRPILLNGIEDLASRGDLLDRMIVLRLPAIKKTGRRPEREFWIEFESASGRIIGALFEVASAALRNLPNVHPSNGRFRTNRMCGRTRLGFQGRRIHQTLTEEIRPKQVCPRSRHRDVRDRFFLLDVM